MNEDRIVALRRLEEIAHRVRRTVVRISENGGCFVGASLSCVDILVSLYAECIVLSPERLDDKDRDLVLLSKGHAVPALYGVLAELGYLTHSRLEHHLRCDDVIYWHPNRAVPGVEFHSGSLGHMLALGVGMAIDAKLRRSRSRVFVLMGDGELNEGSVWEAVLVAQARRLNQLVVIVDRNRFQANMQTEELLPLEPIVAKFDAFGWDVAAIDGHDFQALRAALTARVGVRPSAIIANTTRGCGVPELESRADRWFVRSTATDGSRYMSALAESHRQRLVALEAHDRGSHDTI